VPGSDGQVLERAAATAPAATPRTLREALPVLLRHGSPRLLLAALAAAVAARIALGGFTAWDLAPAAALLALWPLQEWAIHVYILHWRPRRLAGRLLDFRVPRLHRAHHRDPWNPALVFIPFHSFLYSLPLVAALWWAVTPDLRLAATGVACHLALALHYETIHYLIHTRVVPRTRYYRGLWRSHRLHHFRNEHFWFGVTRVGADRWLGTDPEPGAVPSSPTARTLGVADAA
jgi:hypothetical protein